ncbi:hypothetical protein PC121_g19780 [Phytophthora cactorum]|nr:hypothetical protein PC120_g18533 [Phytophthora cactorum]KAG3047920.1 hypothetical protein PC121_g19780 [Phytophthora cactorum]
MSNGAVADDDDWPVPPWERLCVMFVVRAMGRPPYSSSESPTSSVLTAASRGNVASVASAVADAPPRCPRSRRGGLLGPSSGAVLDVLRALDTFDVLRALGFLPVYAAWGGFDALEGHLCRSRSALKTLALLEPTLLDAAEVDAVDISCAGERLDGEGDVGGDAVARRGRKVWP